MSDEDALEREFGTGVVERFATVAAEDVAHHLAERRYLRASVSAAHYVVLTDSKAWPDEDQRRLAEVLLEEVGHSLEARDDLIAAWRASYYVMLTGQRPWTETERDRLASTVETTLAGIRGWDSVSFAGRAIDFMLLGGRPFWNRDELAQMLAAVREDFGSSLKNRDELKAADRLALYRLLVDSLPGWAS
jgi:hypothetical protein